MQCRSIDEIRGLVGGSPSLEESGVITREHLVRIFNGRNLYFLTLSCLCRFSCCIFDNIHVDSSPVQHKRSRLVGSLVILQLPVINSLVLFVNIHKAADYLKSIQVNELGKTTRSTVTCYS